ncbi:hypothetical protein BTIS_0727 [Bifidobacterium tissieri]|uniref:Uncharacterized protein n=1 Tax=Bifidobacterium tissieri TaxID=1630162 RepID=A0A261FH10_9BIFI|nr:hypothetical protein [Bifidobacterium tissieri]OZG58358.1 hypothetical protein BTIS_0727 [Bifidobacterium tissieri]
MMDEETSWQYGHAMTTHIADITDIAGSHGQGAPFDHIGAFPYWSSVMA